MIVKFLGILDLLSALFLGLVLFEVIPERYLLVFAIYLLLKSVIFIIGKDFASMIDFIIGIIFLLLFFKINVPEVVSLVSAFWLLQKAFFSFFSSG